MIPFFPRSSFFTEIISGS